MIKIIIKKQERLAKAKRSCFLIFLLLSDKGTAFAFKCPDADIQTKSKLIRRYGHSFLKETLI